MLTLYIHIYKINLKKKEVFIPPGRSASKIETITFWMFSFRMFWVWGLVIYTLYFNLMMARLDEALHMSQDVGSIPCGVIGIFHGHNPPGHTMALWSIQLLTEMSNRYVSCRKGGQCIELTTLLPSCANCLQNLQPQHPGALTVCPDLYRGSCSFTFHTLKWPSSKKHTGSGLLNCRQNMYHISVYICSFKINGSNNPAHTHSTPHNNCNIM